MSAARSRYNRSAALVIKKTKVVERLKLQIQAAEELLEQATFEKTEANADFGVVSEKYFASARGVIVVVDDAPERGACRGPR